MGDEEREGAARSQHVVLQGPADARTMAAAMRPGVERSRQVTDSAAPACLIITPTVEQALRAAELARVLLADDTSRVVPVSNVSRARRVLNAPVAIVTGTASDLLAVRRESGLRIDGLKALVIVGLDDVLSEGEAESLQALLGDIPADTSRSATLDVESPATEAFLEAQFHRARRMAPPPVGDEPLAVTPTFVITSVAGRAEALRMLLDAVDPPSIVIVANSDESAASATRALTRVGLAVDGVLVQVVRQPTSQHVALVVLWDAPVSSEALTEALATRPVDAVALLSPEELPAFRRLTSGASAAWVPPVRKAKATSRIQRLRTALIHALQHGGGASASELSLLTPLLDDHDPIEIAAASLRLYEGALLEVVAVRAAAAAAAARPVASVGEMRAPRGLTVMQGGSTGGTGKQRVFLAVGKRDQVRVGDIVGAVANEAGIAGERIGSVELFESHTTVELSTEDAARAVAALANSTLRGRRLSARIDERAGEERGARSAPRSERTFGPPRGDRPARSGPGAPRGDRPSGDRPRGDRPSGDRPSGDRPGFDRGGSARPMRSESRPGDRGDSRGAPRGDGRPPARSGPRDAGSRDGGSRDGGSRDGGSRASLRPDAVRRAFGDRPASERTEGTAEWAQRGERMQHAKRTPTPRPERNDEA